MINDTASKDLQEKLQFESRIQLGQMLREQSAPELDWPQSRDPISYRGDSPKPKRQLSTANYPPRGALGLLCTLHLSFSFLNYG